MVRRVYEPLLCFARDVFGERRTRALARPAGDRVMRGLAIATHGQAVKWCPAMTNSLTRSLALAATLGATSALAHFVLEAPLAMYNQNGLGDPQKVPPCGLDNTAVATNKVTTFEAGQTISIRINEKIYHPGHYRVALGLNGPQDIPAEPPVTPGTTDCGSTTIQATPVFPVLADGQLLHSAPFSGAQSFTVKLPSNVTCTNCTLQVLEFMSQHGLNNPGGCFYHHCAVINIRAPDAGTAPVDAGVDAGTPVVDSGTPVVDSGTPVVDSGTPEVDAGASGGEDAGAGGRDAGMQADGGVDPGVIGGCSCSSVDGALALAFAAAAVLLRRRRA
jgi:uncharacterized protein (TIGR03382 family)